jgi:aromatic-L-amino-acid decarboxylase
LTQRSLDELRRACALPLTQPDPETLRALGTAVLDHVVRHHATLAQQPVGRCATRPELEALLAEPAPEEGSDFHEILRQFADKVSPHAFRTNHPRFFAFIPGVPSLLSILGDMLCSGTNFFAGVWLEAAGPAQVELTVLDWFRSFLGMPPSTAGLLTSGGSEANLTALVVARDTLPVEDRPRAVLYLTAQRHHSIDRAARIIGLLPGQVRPVPADGFALTPARLLPLIQEDRQAGRLPWVVVANAGATNTGTIDPLADLANLCAAENLWLHVDAAYGWAAVLTNEGRALLAGIERADSVTLDPHKWLAQTFECGGVLVRRGELLARTFSLRADYLQDAEPEGDEVNFADRGLALTRRFRALKVWLSVKVLGVRWFRDLIRHSFALTELAQRLLEEAGDFEIVSPRRLSIVCFRHVPDELRGDEPALERHNLAVADALRRSGRAFLSTTRLHGRSVLRFCFINWRTTAADVEEVVTLLQDLAKNC